MPQQFSAKVGTILEVGSVSLDRWFVAMWLICSAGNGVSSWELHRAIGVTQKTAWSMLRRIRLALESSNIPSLSGGEAAGETSSPAA
jgi:hypothetical protein